MSTKRSEEKKQQLDIQIYTDEHWIDICHLTASVF